MADETDKNEEKKEPQNEVKEPQEEKEEPQEKKEEAKEEKEEKKEGSADSGEAKAEPKGGGKKLLVWIILAIVIVISAAAGYGAARMFAGASAPPSEDGEQSEPAEKAEPAGVEELVDTGGTSEQISWSIDLEPVIANLDEPQVTRYVRATLTLEMSGAADKAKTEVYITDKAPMVRNWLTIYLAGLRLEDVKGSRNLKRIQAQILDSFNEMLFGESKPLITRVLFKEFAIQ